MYDSILEGFLENEISKVVLIQRAVRQWLQTKLDAELGEVLETLGQDRMGVDQILSGRDANSDLAMRTDLNDLERDKETTFGMEMRLDSM